MNGWRSEERGCESEKEDPSEETARAKRSGVGIPESVPALQTVVVLETVLIDGPADLAADLAADGTATEAAHSSSGDRTEDCSRGDK